MLEDVDQVDWYALSHAFGVATDVPDQLRAMAAPDPEQAASGLRDLRARLSGEDYVHSAAIAAVPFLVEIAASQEVALEVRAGGLLLLGTLAGARSGDPAAARELLAALGRQQGRLGELLNDPEPAIRVATAGLAGRFLSPPQGWTRRLRALRDSETEPLVRAALSVDLSLAEGGPPDRSAIAAAAAVSLEVAVWKEREMSGLLGLRITPAAAGRLGGMLAELAVSRLLW